MKPPAVVSTEAPQEQRWRLLPDVMVPWDPSWWEPLTVTQQHFHQPGDDVPGDCYRACIAALLRHEVEEVPHFLRYSAKPGVLDSSDMDPDNLWWWSANGYLAAHGMWQEHVVLDGHGKDNPASVAAVLARAADVPGPLIVTGRSPRGFEHVVLAYRGRVAWDPHPSRAGLVEAWAYEHFCTLPENNQWGAS